MNHRKIGYDYIRIIACFMVIVNHTISSTIYGFSEGFTGTAFIGDFIFNSCRMNVVSFILISGALLLGKNESYKDWFVKRVLRIVVVILLFSVIYYDWSSGNAADYLRLIFESNITNAFWYLYLYLGIMLTLPLLRKMCQCMENRDFILLIVIFLSTQSIYPLLIHYFNFPAMQWVFSGLFSYWISWYCIFLMGYYFKNLLDKHTIKNIKIFIPVLFIGWFIGNLIPTVLTYREIYYLHDTSLFMDNPFFIWSFAATICFDSALLLISDSLIKYKKFNNIISYISGLTFGIYLLGDKLISIIYPFFTNWNTNQVVKIMAVDIIIFVIGACVTAVLKQIPLIKKLL